MLKTGIIKQLLPERTVTNKRTNESWVNTPILFEWKEDVGKIDPDLHSAIVELRGSKNAERIKQAIANQECIQCDMYFNGFVYGQESDAKGFTSVKGHISKDFDLSF